MTHIVKCIFLLLRGEKNQPFYIYLEETMSLTRRSNALLFEEKMRLC